MRNLFNIPLGACTAPFGSPKKEILNFIGDLIGGVANYGASIYAADANEANNIRTNRTNSEINEQQLAWARENYEMEKAENRFLVDQAYERELENRAHQEQYNSPEETKQRWIDAGFNPSLMMSPTGLAPGNVSSIGSSVGSAPRHNQPNMIPAQQSAPVQAPEIGTFFSRAVDHLLAAQKEEREDYALASDIEVSHLNAWTNFVKAMSDAKKNGMQMEFMKDDMKRAWENLWLEKDKFAADNEWRKMTNDIQERQLAEAQYANITQRIAVESGVNLNIQQSKYLNTLIGSVQKHDQLDASETAQRIISMINNDAAIFEKLGIDKDMTTSQKFKNYVGSVVDAVGMGLAVYAGARSGMKSVPMKPNGYLDNVYKPW